MKKIALVLSLSVFTWGSVSFINSSNSFAAFPISQSATTTTVEQNEAAIQEVAQAASTTTTATQVKAEKKQNFFSKMKSKLGGKSQIVALILVLLVGGLGIHRFYLGYTWQGVVQLLTAGGCGIWALIDLIRIVMGTLQPKNGDYDQTF